MSLVEKIKSLAQEKNITIAELERKTNISNGQIRKWDNITPGVDKVKLVADFFNISVDELLSEDTSSDKTSPEILEKIKSLANENNITISELEKKTNLGNGTISRWDKRTPGVDKIQKVADYFDVSTDYLLGRTDKRRYYDLTEKDEKDIAKELELIIEDLKNTGAIAFSKETAEVDEQTHELLVASLENSLRIARIEAKKRFTPKKYRD